jgi:release factor glutamine methyltransferase
LNSAGRYHEILDLISRLNNNAHAMPRLTQHQQQVTQSRRILEQSSRETDPYLVHILDREFVVFPQVFSPKYLGSTSLFTRSIPFRAGESFLEIGCGTGVTAVMAAKAGARKVVAVDISPEAVSNTVKNAELHGMTDIVDARLSDMFTAILPDERFDTIYWNMPFIYVDREYSFRSMLERSLFDPGYNMTRTFLHDAPRHLEKGGCLLVGFGDFGNVGEFIALSEKLGYSRRELTRGRDLEQQPITFILYELTLPDNRSGNSLDANNR